MAWCQALGAERVVNYRTGDMDREVAEFAPGGVDVYWDTSGKPDFGQAVARVARRGRIVVMAGLTARPPFPVGPFYLKDCSLHGFAVTNATEAELQVAVDEINQWLAQGRVKVWIDRVLPLSAAAQAHRLVEDHAPLAGKIILTPLKVRGRPSGGMSAAWGCCGEPVPVRPRAERWRRTRHGIPANMKREGEYCEACVARGL